MCGTLFTASPRDRRDQLLESVLARLSIGFGIIDREWRLTYANPSMSGMVGMQGADLVGKNVWETFPHLVGGKFFIELHRALEQQTPAHFEFFDALLNRWSEHWAYPSEGALAIFSIDITVRKRREELLVFQASALSQVTDAVFGLDQQYRVTYWNEAAEGLYGYSAEEVLGRPVQEVVQYRWIKPEDETACVNSLRTAGFWRRRSHPPQEDGGRNLHRGRRDSDRRRAGNRSQLPHHQSGCHAKAAR